MRTGLLLLANSLLCWAADPPRAYLRADTPANPVSFYVEAGVPKPLAASRSIPTDVHVTLYQKADRQLSAQVATSTTASPSDRTRFRLNLPPGFRPEVDGTALTVAIHDYIAEDGSTNGWLIPVALEIKSAIVIDEACAAFDFGPYSVAISAETNLADGYAKKRLDAIVDQMKSKPAADLGRLRIEPRNRNTVEPRSIRSFRFLSSGTVSRLCLKTEDRPDVQKYDLELAFSAPTAFELSKPMLLTDQGGIARLESVRAASDRNMPGSRTFERNLDTAVNLTSSVKDVQKNGQPVRERDTQATLDFRFAPWLNWQATPVKRAREAILYWTPFFLDAKASTGSITKDTLSLNRIVVGSEAEIRTYYNTRRFPTYLRNLMRLSNASDRDFKQAEYKLGYEFQPYFGPLNRPLSSNVRLFPNQLDTDPNRSPKIITETSRIGYEFVPIVGAEVGRTYIQRRPAVSFPGDKLVRRLYAGGQLTLNLTAFVKITATERLYIRGEAFDRDPYHNYFNGEIEFPLGGLSAAASQSLFFSFERGGQPPFATPDVNALKLGYRIISNGWFGRLR